ncbi:MAG: KamA family radical SAM protein [Deltaproteobacteria bacterium]|nr:KamA family radical SAM protein [Deltaproteobacteria bacterium]
MSKENLLDTPEEPPSGGSLDRTLFANAEPEPSRPNAGAYPLPYSQNSSPGFSPLLPAVPRLTVSDRSHRFRKMFYPQVTTRDWNNWRWQSRNRLKTLEDFERVLTLTGEEREALGRFRHGLPAGVTPYYASLLDPVDPNQPLRKTIVPVMGEFLRSPGEADDPLGEDGHSPVPGLVHRYPDRVLLLATSFCAAYCRYCTRSRMVGGSDAIGRSKLEAAIAYIRNTPAIRDVLISGGDPLTLDENRLDWLLGELRAIPHVEFLRIGSKVPAVVPQRITPSLIKVLRKYHPLWISLHFTHPDEITPETAEACERLADAGIPLGSQTVLLKGVNDNPDTMKRLMHNLLKIRVRPYYIYMCDPITGSSHFRTSVDAGLDIIRSLRGHTTGYAVPTLVVDAPGGGGKIPLLPNYLEGHDNGDWLLTNFEGKSYRYPDPSLKDRG